MWFSKKQKEKKENESRLRKLQGREVRYVTTRDSETYDETIIGKYGEINITNDEFNIVCDNKTIFSHPIYGLMGAELMSLDGIILTYEDENTSKEVKLIVYYKYHRK